MRNYTLSGTDRAQRARNIRKVELSNRSLDFCVACWFSQGDCLLAPMKFQMGTVGRVQVWAQKVGDDHLMRDRRGLCAGLAPDWAPVVIGGGGQRRAKSVWQWWCRGGHARASAKRCMLPLLLAPVARRCARVGRPLESASLFAAARRPGGAAAQTAVVVGRSAVLHRRERRRSEAARHHSGGCTK